MSTELKVPHHPVVAWQKRFGDIQNARMKVHQAYERGFKVSVRGKTKKGYFDPESKAIVIVKHGVAKTVLFAENQELKYKEDVYCHGCGNRVNNSKECPGCGSETHRYKNMLFDVDW